MDELSDQAATHFRDRLTRIGSIAYRRPQHKSAPKNIMKILDNPIDFNY